MSRSNLDKQSEEQVRKYIRTLTSVLQKFKAQKSPSRQPQDILPFLSHFTTLLTCGDKRDNQAKRVIAVTGSIGAANQVRTLVVAQNPRDGSSTESMSLQLVKTDKRSFAEVVNGPPNALLVDHIADVWTALSCFDQRTNQQQQVEALELFVLSRSYRKFVARFKEDERLCERKRLYDVIREWRPERSTISRKWVTPPGWLLNSEGMPQIKSRRTGKNVEWEFSDDTKHAWSKVLEILLRKVNDGIERVKPLRGQPGKKAEEDLRKAMGDLNVWCRALYYFVVWDKGIVKSLLTQTNIVAGITTTFMSTRAGSSDETDDDMAELRQEPEESKGQQVFRYLKTVVAWHAAVHRLTLLRDGKLPELLKNLEIGLVEAPRSQSSVVTLDKFTETFFTRFNDMENVRESAQKVLKEQYSNTFTGCIHAEATLMGLVNYYVHESSYTSHAALLKNAQIMRKIVQPVADGGNAVIAVSKKCCWCCDWLGQNLETQFKLPGTHGIMYGWDPPVVGVGLAVLKRLEEVLWGELYRAVSSAIEPAYSRHSSAASSPEGMAMDDMFSYVLKA